MSASASANDLGSMGAPSSDAALRPLIDALTANTTALGANTDKLDSLQNVISVLSAGINSLRVGIERLTESLSRKSAKSIGKSQSSKIDQASLDAGMAYGPTRQEFKTSQEKNKQKTKLEQNQKEIDDLERKWLVREYKDRLAWNKKQGKETEALEQKWLNKEYADRKKATENEIKSKKSPFAAIGKIAGGVLGGVIGKNPGAVILGEKIGEHVGNKIGSKDESNGFHPVKGAVKFVLETLFFRFTTIGKAILITTTAVRLFNKALNWLVNTSSKVADAAAAFAPGIANGLRFALKDLSAVFGVYYAYIAQALTPLIRIVADSLLPVMRTAGQVFGNIIKMITPIVKAFMAVISSFATLFLKIADLFFKFLEPFIRGFGAGLSLLSVVLTALVGAATGVIDAFEYLFSGIINFGLKIASNMEKTVEAIRQAIINLTKDIPFIGKAIKNALAPASTMGLAAASSARLTSAAAISETVAQNAFLATSGGIDPQNELAKQMLENDIPNKWAKMLDANGNVVINPNFRMNDGGGANAVNANPVQNNGLALKLGK